MSAPARPTQTTTLTPATYATTFTRSVDGSLTPSVRRHAKLSIGLIAAALAALALTPAAAQAQTRQVIEYTCPLTSGQTVPPTDPNPGALVAEGGYVYYVTRTGELRLVRLTPGTTAVCNWWDLDALTVTTGGLRFKAASNLAFIRGVTDLQRVNTMTNVRSRWVDGLTSVSDVAIKTSYSTTSVFTTGAPGCVNPIDPVSCLTAAGSVQRFSVVNGNTTGTLTRWVVGGGAGLVQYSGIDINPCYPNLIYYSEPLGNNIGELDTATNKVRRWNLSGLGVAGPRQLNVDDNGIVWVGTASGQLVRLNPKLATSNVNVIEVPLFFLNDVVAIDADAVIGYTTGGVEQKVGQFSPDLSPLSLFTVTPSVPTTVSPSPLNANLPATTSVTITQFTGSALRVPKTALAAVTSGLDGEFVEALLPTGLPDNLGDCFAPTLVFPEDPCTPSAQPQGIANDPAKCGAYFAAVGSSVLRIAHVSLLAPMTSGGGAMIGSGQMTLTDPITGLPAGTGTFTAWAYKTSQSQPVKGALTFTAPDGQVQSLQLTGLTFSGNTATLTGLCQSGNCGTFQVKATDGGWQAAQDIFKITKDPILGLGLEKGGNLGSGGIRTYRQ